MQQLIGLSYGTVQYISSHALIGAPAAERNPRPELDRGHAPAWCRAPEEAIMLACWVSFETRAAGYLAKQFNRVRRRDRTSPNEPILTTSYEARGKEDMPPHLCSPPVLASYTLRDGKLIFRTDIPHLGYEARDAMAAGRCLTYCLASEDKDVIGKVMRVELVEGEKPQWEVVIWLSA